MTTMKTIAEVSKEHATRVLSGLPPVGYRNELADSEWIERFEEIFKESAKFVQEWIDVNNELPEAKEKPYEVLIMDKNGGAGVWWIESQESANSIKTFFTKWRPLNRE